MKPRFVVGLLFLAALFIVAQPGQLWAKTVEELRAELNARREQLKEAESNIAQFKQEIQLKKREARTLEEQIDLMDYNIDEIELTITRTLAEVEKTNSEIESVAAEIAQREEEIIGQKAKLAEYIRAMHILDQQSTVTVFLKYATFSEAVSEAATYQELQNRGQETLVAVQQLRDELSAKQRELEDFKQTLEALQRRQEQQQQTLTVQRNSKERILQLTNAQEVQFQQLLKQSQQAHQAADADIKQIDQLIREELRKQGIGKLPAIGILDWPVEAIFGVSCPFHCAGYPYQYLIGPHAGIDIPTYVGTPIRAPADGYVARLHDAGGPGYSYILMLHGESVSTVYGHVSGFATNEGQLVTRGTIIGYTGGAPGTRGAGLSSGPHLHFEVRVNNTPVDPAKYL
ncbi:MAG: peptidoglycan DD-metalloendopeptidase family protein [Candidatus Andersenbacteria bacterium]